MDTRIIAFAFQIIFFVEILFFSYFQSSCGILSLDIKTVAKTIRIKYEEVLSLPPPKKNKKTQTIIRNQHINYIDLFRFLLIKFPEQYNRYHMSYEEMYKYSKQYIYKDSLIGDKAFFYLIYPEEMYRLWMLSSFPVDTGDLVSKEGVQIRIYFNADKEGEVLVPIKTEKKDQYYKVYYGLEDGSQGYFSKPNYLPDSIKIETEWIALDMLRRIKINHNTQKYIKRTLYDSGEGYTDSRYLDDFD